MKSCEIGGIKLTERLILGTALYPSPDIMQKVIAQSHCEVITVSVRRQIAHRSSGSDTDHHTFWDHIKPLGCHLLPNTAGCKSAQEAIQTAHIARELFDTNWIKLEVIGDEYSLAPHPFELLKAAKQLIADGFVVWPYTNDDLIVCQHLVDLGCPVVMPWAAPIGSGQGLQNPRALQMLRERLPDTLLIIDAGIGTPSDACEAMEMGFDGVLMNSAVALAHDPVTMSEAFRQAVQAGLQAHQAGRMPKRTFASPSTPHWDKPLWQNALLKEKRQA